ncbi:MAG: KH domain-containing protein [Fimbriimonadaceae bacterium]|nr:KH domain-containing protein [Fimbriimonadaceae bacterium]
MTTDTSTDTTVEIRGASVEDATAAAAKKLGVDPSDLEVKIVEKSAGLFGREEVTIAASVSPKPKRGRAKKEAPVEEEPAKKPAGRKAKEPAKAREPKAEPEPNEDSDGPEATQEIAQQYVAELEKILELADLDATVTISEVHGRYVNLDIDGQDASYLVGRKGEVLNALQYLMNVIGVHTFAGGVRVSLEADDYRKRRADVLTKLAEDIASEVLKRGEEAVLDALPAFERRIVHQALSEIEGVSTYSEGEEPDRRVVIAPAQ